MEVQLASMALLILMSGVVLVQVGRIDHILANLRLMVFLFFCRFLLVAQESHVQYPLAHIMLLGLLLFLLLLYQVDLQVSIMRSYLKKVLNLHWFFAISNWVSSRYNLTSACIWFSCWMFSGLFSVLFGTVAVIFSDGSKVVERGFFDGYNSAVWLVVMLQVCWIISSLCDIHKTLFFFSLGVRRFTGRRCH